MSSLLKYSVPGLEGRYLRVHLLILLLSGTSTDERLVTGSICYEVPHLAPRDTTEAGGQGTNPGSK